MTIILITHEMEVVREITNQVAVMDHGRIVEQGPTTQLFLNPQQPLIRELLVDGDQGADEMATLIILLMVLIIQFFGDLVVKRLTH